MTDNSEERRIEFEIHREGGGGTDPFAAAVRATRMPMLITDPRQPDNPIVFVNDSFARLTGYSREETLGRNCRFAPSCSAYALEALVLSRQTEAIERQANMRITTVGAVTALPTAFTNAGQYLGELDWFGGMNSRLALDYTTIPGAWHHLNTRLPGHLDLADVLSQEPA